MCVSQHAYSYEKALVTNWYSVHLRNPVWKPRAHVARTSSVRAALTVHEGLHGLVHVEVELLQHQHDLVVAFVGHDGADRIDLEGGGGERKGSALNIFHLGISHRTDAMTAVGKAPGSPRPSAFSGGQRERTLATTWTPPCCAHRSYRGPLVRTPTASVKSHLPSPRLQMHTDVFAGRTRVCSASGSPCAGSGGSLGSNVQQWPRASASPLRTVETVTPRLPVCCDLHCGLRRRRDVGIALFEMAVFATGQKMLPNTRVNTKHFKHSKYICESKGLQ